MIELDEELVEKILEMRGEFVERISEMWFVDYAEDQGESLPEQTIVGIRPIIVAANWNDTCKICSSFKDNCRRNQEPILGSWTGDEVRKAAELIERLIQDRPYAANRGADSLRSSVLYFYKDEANDVPEDLLLSLCQGRTRHEFVGVITGTIKSLMEEYELDPSDLADKLGVDLDELSIIDDVMCIHAVWSDCTSECYGCGKALNTEPDSYGWKPAYVEIEDDGLYCIECMKSDPEAYFQSVINHEKDGTLLDPTDYGFVRVKADEYSSWAHGWHDGQNDSPSAQRALLNKHGFDVIFEIFPSQFYIEWDLFVRPEGHAVLAEVEYSDEMKEFIVTHVRQLIADGDCKVYPTPAEQMKAALKEASRQSAELRKESPDGVIHSTCCGDGTATTKVISREDFAKGRR